MSLDARSIERRLSKMESAIARVNARPIAPVRQGRGGGGGGMDEVTAEDRAALEAMTLEEGAFCRTTGAIKRAYKYVGGALICYTHLESS